VAHVFLLDERPTTVFTYCYILCMGMFVKLILAQFEERASCEKTNQPNNQIHSDQLLFITSSWWMLFSRFSNKRIF
jgi:hypothetical protein